MQNPFLHQTDLFHPHNDPDDHWDLACVFSLAQANRLDLAGILIDYAHEDRTGDPATLAVAQLGACHGMTGIPVAIGGRTSPSAASEWLLRALRDAPAPVTIMIVGSCIDVAAAAIRAPDVFEKKCRGIYLNAGAAFTNDAGELEWNVALNPAAYAAMFDVPCPLYWCPCFHRVNDFRVGKNGTWYNFRQGDILQTLSPQLQNYFLYMLGKSNDPQYLRYLERPVDQTLFAKHADEMRNMWCTAPILHAAGLTVDDDGVIGGEEIREPLFTFEPITAQCDDNGEVSWQGASAHCRARVAANRFIFTVHDVERYAAAMKTALWRMLKAPEMV